MRHLRTALAVASVCGLAALCVGAPKSSSNPVIEMTIEQRGKIVIELFPKDAPKTVAHMLDLCKRKFYDGILVHRVVPDFVVQAGDPKTKNFKPDQLARMTPQEIQAAQLGAGGSGKNIPFEVNSRTHEPGTVAMALSGPRSDTGDSQWFINLVPNHSLDGDYCVFGKVTKGMDVVKKVRQGDRIASFKRIK